jgi:hypothetical protein
MSQVEVEDDIEEDRKCAYSPSKMLLKEEAHLCQPLFDNQFHLSFKVHSEFDLVQYIYRDKKNH